MRSLPTSIKITYQLGLRQTFDPNLKNDFVIVQGKEKFRLLIVQGRRNNNLPLKSKRKENQVQCPYVLTV